MYKLKVKEINALVRTIHSKSEALEYFTKAATKEINAFDYETSGLSWEKGYIVGTSFCCDRKEAVYIPMQHRSENAEPEAIAVMVDFMRETPLAAHNMNFEYGWTKHHMGFDLKILTDSMVAIGVENSNNPSGLKDYVKRVYRHDQQTFKEVTQGTKDFTRVSVKDGFYYACSDSLWTYRIIADLEPKINADKGMASIYKLEKQVIPLIVEMHFKGIRIDTVELDNQKGIITESVNQMEKDIYTMIQTECPSLAGQYDIMGNMALSVNINSPKDLLKIFGLMGIPLESTSKDALGEVDHPLAKKILEYRQEVKLLSTYNTPFYDMMEAGDIVHQGLKIIGAPTGRLSGASPNLMAIPKIRT